MLIERIPAGRRLFLTWTSWTVTDCLLTLPRSPSRALNPSLYLPFHIIADGADWHCVSASEAPVKSSSPQA
jgi:hypothetical protein